MRRALPFAAISIPFVSLFFALHLRATTTWITPFELAISTALAGAALATIPAVLAGWRRVSIAIPIVLLTANIGFMVVRAAGVKLGTLELPDVKFAIAI